MKPLALLLLLCPAYVSAFEIVQLRLVPPAGAEGTCRLVTLFELETQATSPLAETERGRSCDLALAGQFDFCALSAVAQYGRSSRSQGYAFRGSAFECGVRRLEDSWRFQALALSPSRQMPFCSFICLEGLQ